jgi:hypothetical protein
LAVLISPLLRNFKFQAWTHLKIEPRVVTGSAPLFSRCSSIALSHLQPTEAEASIEADELIAAQIDDLTIDNAIYVRGRPARIVSLDFPLVFWRFDDEDVVKHRSFNQSRALFQVSASVHASNVSAAAVAAASEASLGANGSGDRDRDELDDEDDWAAFENASSALPDNSARVSAAAAAFSADLASLQRVHESEQQQHRAADAFDDGFGDDELEFAPVSAPPSADAAAASGSAEQPHVISPDPEYARAAGEFKNNFMYVLAMFICMFCIHVAMPPWYFICRPRPIISHCSVASIRECYPLALFARQEPAEHVAERVSARSALVHARRRRRPPQIAAPRELLQLRAARRRQAQVARACRLLQRMRAL